MNTFNQQFEIEVYALHAVVEADASCFTLRQTVFGKARHKSGHDLTQTQQEMTRSTTGSSRSGLTDNLTESMDLQLHKLHVWILLQKAREQRS